MKGFVFGVALLLFCGATFAQSKDDPCAHENEAIANASKGQSIFSNGKAAPAALYRAREACMKKAAHDVQVAEERRRQEKSYRPNSLRNSDDGTPVTMANFSGNNAGAANQHGWTFLGENESDAYWFSYWTNKDTQEVAVVMKDGVKGVGNGYVMARFITGFIDCRGSESGDFPSMLNMASSETWSFRKGQMIIPIANSGMPSMPIPVVRGTVMAEIIKRVCPLTSDIWNVATYSGTVLAH